MYRRLLGVLVTGPKSRPGFWCRAPPRTQTPPAAASAGACRRSPSCTTRCLQRARRHSSWKRGWMCWTRCGCAARAVQAVPCCSCSHSNPAGQHCTVSCMTAPHRGAGCSSRLPSSILVRPLIHPSSHPHPSSPPPPNLFQVSGVPRDNYTYSTLMSICQASGDLPTALRLFREMQEEGLTPNTGEHSVLMPCSRCCACSACLPGCSQGAVGTAEPNCAWLARLPTSLA